MYDNRIYLQEYSYDLEPIQMDKYIDSTKSNDSDDSDDSDELKSHESFSSCTSNDKSDYLIDNIEFCSDPTYKIIVTLILIGIIAFFIWFVSRKKYWDDSVEGSEISTPFN
jgi:hypothetical protein